MFISSFLRPLILLSVLAAAAVTDAAFHKVYNSQILLGAVSLGLVSLLQPPQADPVRLTYSIGFILILFFFYSGKMIGGADIKLYMLTTLAYPDRNGNMILVLSIILGAVCSAALIIKNRLGKGEEVHKLPLGIFIFAAACITLLTL